MLSDYVLIGGIEPPKSPFLILLSMAGVPVIQPMSTCWRLYFHTVYQHKRLFILREKSQSLYQYDGLRTFSQGKNAVVFVVTISLPTRNSCLWINLISCQRMCTFNARLACAYTTLVITVAYTVHRLWSHLCKLSSLTTDRFVIPPPKAGKQWLEHYW